MTRMTFFLGQLAWVVSLAVSACENSGPPVGTLDAGVDRGTGTDATGDTANDDGSAGDADVSLINGSVERVRNINTRGNSFGGTSSNPSMPTKLGQKLLFFANDGQTGSELWQTNGAANGTSLVADINPGVESSVGSKMIAWRDGIWFPADDGTHGTELWVSDGTAGGTRLVRDLIPGNGSLRLFSQTEHSQPLVPMGEHLYFINVADAHQYELWRTNGTTFERVVHVDPIPWSMTATANRLFFTTSVVENDVVSAIRLWVSDGTEKGTTAVSTHGIQGGDFICASPLFQLDADRIIFSAARRTKDKIDVWVSDGTEKGTQVIATDTGCVKETARVGSGKLAFFGGRALWHTDGTPNGTRVVRDGFFSGEFMGSLEQRVLFKATFVDGAITQTREFWITDGSTNGTVSLGDLNPGHGTISLAPRSSSSAVIEQRLVFRVDDGINGAELWTTDGALSGTALVADIEAGPKSSESQKLRKSSRQGRLLGPRQPVRA